MHPDELDPVERLQLRMFLDELFDTWAYIFRTGSPENEAESHKDHIRGTLAQPGGAEHWARARSAFSPEFAEYIDRVGRSD